MMTLSKLNNGISVWDLFDNHLLNEDWSHWRRNIVPNNEDENSYSYFLNLAGFKKEDVEAAVNDGLVSVNAKNKAGSTASYSFLLPDGVDVSTMTAKLEDGLLTVTLEKEAKLKPKSIEIK